MVFRWISYALAIGAWNTVFVGILIGISNLIYKVMGYPLLTKFEIISTFIVCYAILFALNVKIIDEGE